MARYVPAAEGQSAKVLVNRVQQLLGSWQPQRNVANIKVLHVMARLQILPDIAFPCKKKRRVMHAVRLRERYFAIVPWLSGCSKCFDASNFSEL